MRQLCSLTHGHQQATAEICVVLLWCPGWKWHLCDALHSFPSLLRLHLLRAHDALLLPEPLWHCFHQTRALQVWSQSKCIHPPHKTSCQTHIPEPPRETKGYSLVVRLVAPSCICSLTLPWKIPTFLQFKVFCYQKPLLSPLELKTITFLLFNNQTTALFQLPKAIFGNA